jgi:hydrogenase expression/formation protein HypE
LPPEDAEAVLERMQRNACGKETSVIGEVRQDHPGRVVMKTRIGASRIVDMLVGEPLPHIC